MEGVKYDPMGALCDNIHIYLFHKQQKKYYMG